MPNPLYNDFGPENNINDIISRARQLRANFSGNPREEVQRLLNSGQMTQEQFNHLMPIAQKIAGMIK